MNLIIGGAYQGKLQYAKEKYGFEEKDIFFCREDKINFCKPCVADLAEFTWACIEKHTDPVAYFHKYRDQWKDSVLICRDIFCGVVPMGADQRTWRRQTGLLCQYLSREAQSVTRIFCGLEQKLK